MLAERAALQLWQKGVLEASPSRVFGMEGAYNRVETMRAADREIFDEVTLWFPPR